MFVSKIIQVGDNYMEFYIEDIETHILNAVRRAILTEVPTLAIHEVIIHQNTSSLYDEVIAHRLAMIPLIVDKEEIDLLGECSCRNPSIERCYKCTARLRLAAKNTSKKKIITIYAKDIEPIDKKSVRPVIGEIPILKLGPGQEIEIEMIAKVGRGKDHAKWQPTSTLGYKPIPIVKVSEDCEGCPACVEACPKDVLKLKDNRPVIEGLGLYICDLDRLCVRACPKKALELEPDETRYFFRIESVGQLTIKEIFESAIQNLNEIVDEFETKLEDAIESHVKVTTSE